MKILSIYVLIFLVTTVSCVSENDDRRDQVQSEKKSIEKVESKNLQKQYESVFRDFGAINIDSLIQKSKFENKPILLYFMNYNTSSNRKFEEKCIKSSQILTEFQSDFIFCVLATDDRRKLDKTDWIYSEKLNRRAKTIGEINIFYQIEMFEMATTPYFVALNADQEILGSGGYENFRNFDDFQDFLRDVKSEFRKEN